LDSQRYDIAVSYFIRGEHEQAARTFAEILQDTPDEPRCWTYLGMAYAHLGRAAEAEQALSKAIELGPKNPDAWFHLGVARGMRSEWTRAVSAYRYAVALAPDDLVAWHRLGVALAESGDEAGSEAAFERALVLSRETGAESLGAGGTGGSAARDGPDDHLSEQGEVETIREAKSWLDLALSLLSLGDEEEAVAAFERAYTLDPERARQSLFRPMLRLVASATGDPGPSTGPARPGPPQRPSRPGTAPVEPDLSDLLGPEVP
jgi:tetratricopeptide (TPR) repeat protein